MSNIERLKSYELIDRMHLALSSARPIPLTGKVMVEKDEFVRLLEQLEQSIPEDMQKARDVLKDIEKLIADSKAQAESLVAQANDQATKTVDQANQQAQDTVNQANQQATNTVNMANHQATEATRSATEQANAMVADAQARAQAMVADAQAQADQLVAESEIVARATAQAQEMLESARRDCDDYSMRVHASVSQMVSQADMALVQQLDGLRALQQEINMSR